MIITTNTIFNVIGIVVTIAVILIIFVIVSAFVIVTVIVVVIKIVICRYHLVENCKFSYVENKRSGV